MGAIFLIGRSEIRRRLRSLIGLALLVSLVAAVVLTALAGARRTETSFDRFREASNASDVWVQVSDFEPAAEVVAAMDDLPMVDVAAGWRIAPADPLEGPDDTADFALVGDPLGRYGIDIDRPRMIEGRMPAPDALDEVLLTRSAAETFGLSVGDQLVVQTFSPADLEALVTSDGFPGLNGPELELAVVGVGLWPEELGGRAQSSSLAGVVSPAFDAAHLDDVGSWPISTRIRLATGPDQVTALTEAVRAIAGDTEVLVDEAADDHVLAIQSAVDALATATAVFALIAAAAGLVVIGQAVSRQIVANSVDPTTLAALGLPATSRVMTLFIPVALAGTVGVLVGALISTLASPLLPVGMAREAEPDPGVYVDPLALVVGSLMLLGLVIAWTLIASWRGARLATVTRDARRPSRIATSLARSGVRPEPVAGVRFAYESGSGRTAVPVRAAIVGGALGVAGVVAVSVVAVSLAALAGSPDRWGWTWSSRPDILGAVDPAIDVLVADERIESVAGLKYAAIEIDGAQMEAYSVESLKGSITFALLDGREPTSPSEIALGRRTLRDLGLEVGDRVSVEAADRSGAVDLAIVGMVATPLVDSSDPGRGAVVTGEGLDVIRQSDGSEQLLLRYEEGLDVAALEADLAETADLGFPIYARPDPPGEVTNLEQVQGVTIALASFFLVLGAVGVTHALMVSVRRRRPDLGVLRVLGFKRGQVRRAVAWQGVTIAGTSALVGIPAGLVVGRATWQALVGDMGVVTDPSQPWLVVVLVLPAAVVVAVVASWLPARRALRVGPAAALRAE